MAPSPTPKVRRPVPPPTVAKAPGKTPTGKTRGKARGGKGAPKSTGARRPRERLLVDERRAQLLALALELFGERSYDDISVEELARAAGVSKGLLYHYFPTKRDFYVQAIAIAAERLLEMTIAADVDAAPEERARRGIATYLDFVERHASAYTTLMRGGIGADPEVAAILETTRATFVLRIASQVPAELAGALPGLALRGWVGFVEAVALEWLAARAVPREEVVSLCAAMLFQTVMATGGAMSKP